jgi:hypothetical protein
MITRPGPVVPPSSVGGVGGVGGVGAVGPLGVGGARLGAPASSRTAGTLRAPLEAGAAGMSGLAGDSFAPSFDGGADAGGGEANVEELAPFLRIPLEAGLAGVSARGTAPPRDPTAAASAPAAARARSAPSAMRAPRFGRTGWSSGLALGASSLAIGAFPFAT